jgi:hypothetical protein
VAISVANGTTWATNFYKGITFASADELIIGNNVQNVVSGYYRWHWLQSAGTNIAVTLASGQGYSIAAGDINKVLEMTQANLLSGSTQLPDLIIFSDFLVPLTGTTGQSIAVSLNSPTTIRLWPAPDASYTFQFRYYARPVVFTANTESYQCPDNFGNVVRAGVIWEAGKLLDDDRVPQFQKDFYESLAKLRDVERATMGVRR